MKRIYLATALIVSVAAPSLVYAAMDHKEAGHPRIEKMFERHDENKDGKVTKEEMSQKGEKLFELLDLDKDGAITLKEAREGHQKMREKRKAEMMMKVDTNSDGQVSEAEFTDYTLKKFKKADANGDGNLSMEEMAKMREHKGYGKKRWMKHG